MKKYIALFLTITMILPLFGCGKSEAAKNADNLISAIGEVSLGSKDAIEAAESAVDELSTDDYSQVEGLDTLNEARLDYNALEIEDAINSIGEVNKSKESKITSARSAYNSASDEVKDRIDNLDVLEAAEAKWDDIQVKEVEELIDAIGEVTLDSNEKISSAKEAYQRLKRPAQIKVSNYEVLASAQDALDELLKENYNAAVSRMRIDTDEIRNMTFYTPMQMPYYNNSRCTMLPYIGQSGNNVWLKLRFNYAGSDWVFFEKATIAVDDARYYKTFSHYDITRDVGGGGRVGELIDIDPTDADIKMLREIITSEKTIVRFEGDDHWRDYTLTNDDKAAIKDVFIIYDYLTKK